MKSFHHYWFKTISWFLFTFFILHCMISGAFANAPNKVQNLHSVSHVVNQPSSISQIGMVWDAPSGDIVPNAYYTLFNNESTYVFNEFNSALPSVKKVTAREVVSSDYSLNDPKPDDVSYYFHVASMRILNDEEFISETISYGPIRIDVVAPSSAKVIAPAVTKSRIISITLGATGANQMYISNVGYGNAGAWEDFKDSKNFELSGLEGQKTIYVQFKDKAGNITNTSTTTLLDLTNPSLSIQSSISNITNQAPIPVTVTFSENVTGFDSSDVTIVNATLSDWTTIGTSSPYSRYTFKLNPILQGNISVSIPESIASDSAGNTNTAASPLTFLYDSVRPNVTITSPTSSTTNSAPIPVTITFGEPVMMFDISDIAITNGTLINFKEHGTGLAYTATYSVDITPQTNGVVSLNIVEGVAKDAAGNTSTASNQLTRTYNPTRPSISPIDDQYINSGNSTQILTFSVGNPNTYGGILIASAKSDKPEIVPNSDANLTIEGVGQTYTTATVAAGSSTSLTLVVTPLTSTYGVVTITLTVTDSTTDTNSTSFVLTINGKPEISTISNVTTSEDTAKSASFVITEVNGDRVSIAALSQNTTLLSNDKISISGAGVTVSNGLYFITPTAQVGVPLTVTINPNENQYGNTSVMLTVTDPKGLTSSSTFGVSVLSVNDKPKVSDIPNVTTNEDIAYGPINFTVSDIEPSTLTVSVYIANSTLIPSDSNHITLCKGAMCGVTDLQITTAGNVTESLSLTILPALNISGASLITVTVSDSELSGSDSFTMTVNPVNDRPTIDNQTFSVKENEQNGVTINAVVANDIEKTPLTYAILSGNIENTFAINKNDGMLSVNNRSTLDYEIRTNIILSVAVNDGEYTSTANITIRIDNLNDNSPEINAQEFTINENSLPNTVAYTVVASDKDNNPLTYDIISAGSPFGITQSTGQIYVTGALNYESIAAYNLVVRVTDGAYTQTAMITAKVADINESPEITGATWTIDENSAKDTLVGTVQASDVDKNPLTYRILQGNVSDAFAINSQTGAITVNKTSELDFETTKSYTLTVAASDGQYSPTALTVINIRDKNEPPTIQPANLTVVENASVGTVIGQIQASDPDTNPQFNTLTYNIIAGNIDNTFTIANNGNIVVDVLPDYEKTSAYVLKISVSDNANQPTVDVPVTITNINDNAPVVQSIAYTVTENTAAGSYVGKITATDADQNALTFSITAGNTGNAFSISPTNGDITVNGSLDYETIKSYTLTVQASDGEKNGSGTVLISLANTNDNSPTFQQEYIIWEDENKEITYLISTIEGYDADGDSLLYSIVQGDTQNVFNIDSKGQIRVSGQLDYEKTPVYKLIVQVADNQYTGTGKVTINLRNLNDNPPIITSDRIYVQENVPLQSVAGKITATDADYSPLTFAIIGGNSPNSFAIGNAGQFTVISQLDYESVPYYTLTVLVSDQNYSVTSTVWISVTNLNDNAPDVANSTGSVSEKDPINKVVLAIKATDKDFDTLTYDITAGNVGAAFTVNSAGNLLINTSLDFEQIQQYLLTVNVSDGMQSHSQNATITVTVQDFNEYSPVMNQESYKFSIDENSPQGALVGTVGATDKDPTSRMNFYVSLGSPFIISDSSSGKIVVNNPTLDYEVIKSYTMTVRVEDESFYYGTANLLITLNNRNDNAPVVNDQIFELNENASIGSSVGTVQATDKDNDTLEFSIIGGNVGNAFIIGTNSGLIAVNASPDYEKITEYNLVISVKDAVFTDTATITIKVKNSNDNPPQMVSSKYAFDINENSPKGTTVGNVAATDIDGDSLLYRILDGNTGNAFSITQTTGTIWVDNTIDYETQSAYTLTVDAWDGKYTNVAQVLISIKDVNEFAPQMEQALYVVKPNENTENGTVIGKVTATDQDPTAVIVYNITQGNEDEAFAINDKTGQVSVVKSNLLDYEKITRYTLTIRGSDGTYLANAVFRIEIQNINDNSPSSEDQNFVIPENSPKGSFVGKVIATDVDVDSLNYTITNAIPNNPFAIAASSGDITVNDSLNYEVTKQYSLLITVTDGKFSDTAMISIAISNVNESPIAYTNTVETKENQAAKGQLKATDEDGDSLKYAISQPLLENVGTITLNENSGEFTFTPNVNVIGTYEFQFIAYDINAAPSAQAKVTIKINPINHAPVAENGTLTVKEAESQASKLTATDKDNQTLTYAIVTKPQFGDLTLTNVQTGEYVYTSKTPNKSVDSFTFKANDGEFDSNIATVTISIITKNKPPVASNNNFVTDEDTPVSGQLSVQDDNPEDKLTYIIVAMPLKGTLSLISSTGVFAYTPAKDQTDSVTFTFKANDSVSDSNIATINIYITPLNDPPAITLAQTPVTYVEAKAQLIDAAANITDVDSIDFQNGYFKVEITENATADDRLKINSETTQAVEGKLYIDEANAKIFFGMSPIGSYTGGIGTVALNISLNVSSDLVGLNALIRNIQFDNVSNRPSTKDRKVQFTMNDGDGGISAPVSKTIMISSVAEPPILSSFAALTVDEGSLYTQIQLDNYVTDNDSFDNEIVWTVSESTNITVTITNRVATVSAKDQNWSGAETLTFTAKDPDGLTDSKQWEIKVTPVNDPPVIIKTIPNQNKSEQQTFDQIDFDTYILDVDNAKSELSLTCTGQKDLIVVIVNRIATLSVPSQAWIGAETIRFTISDPSGLTASQEVSFTITAINDPPVISAIPNQTKAEGSLFDSILLDNYVSDQDNSDDQITWSYTVNGETNLTVTISNARVATISAVDTNWNGLETVTFTAKDPGNLTATAQVIFTVTPVNDPPSVNPIQNQTKTEGTVFDFINLDPIVYDPDNSQSQLTWTYSGQKDLRVTIVNRIATVSVPNENWNGSETIIFTAQDPAGLTGSTSAKFEVTPVNDPPTISSVTNKTINEDTATEQILVTITDIETPSNQLELTAKSGNISLVPIANIKIEETSIATVKTITIRPVADQFGTTQILLTVSDKEGLTAWTSFALTVNPVNDAPKVSSIGNLVLLGNETKVVTFQVSDSETESSQLNVSKTFSKSDNLVFDITDLTSDQSGQYSMMVQGSATSDQSGVADVTVTVRDPEGLIGTTSFKVSIKPSDNVPPVITLRGNNPVVVSLDQSEPYNKDVDAGADAIDDVDGNVTESIQADYSDVDRTKAGQYNVKYTVKDKAGNTAVQYRTVYVLQMITPTGKVYSLYIQDRIPLSQVTVSSTLSSYTTVTGNDGAFTYQSLQSGKTGYFIFTKTGYISVSKSFKGESSLDDIVMETQAQAKVLSGVCKDFSGKVLSDVRLTVSESVSYSSTGFTDKDGKFSIPLKESFDMNNLTWDVFKYGYIIADKANDIVSVGDSYNITMTQETRLIVTTLDLSDRVEFVVTTAKTVQSFASTDSYGTEIFASAEGVSLAHRFNTNNKVYTITHTTYQDLKVTLLADTTEDHNVNTGYTAKEIIDFKALPKDSHVTTASTSVSIDSSNPIVVATPTNTEQVLEIVIPPSGLQGEYIPITMTFAVKEVSNHNSSYAIGTVMEINASDQNGKDISGDLSDPEDPLREICITMRYSDPITKQGLLSGNYMIIHSSTVSDVLQGKGNTLNIAETAIDDNEKTVRICVEHLSAFGYIKKTTPPVSAGGGNGGGSCFVLSIASDLNIRIWILLLVVVFVMVIVAGSKKGNFNVGAPTSGFKV